MQTIIDLEPELLQRLDAWAAERGQSRADAVRKAIDHLLDSDAPTSTVGFGLWLQAGPVTPDCDGLTVQRKLREDWPD